MKNTQQKMRTLKMDNIDTDDEKITKESLFHLYVRTLVNRSLSVNKEKAKEKKKMEKASP